MQGFKRCQHNESWESSGKTAKIAAERWTEKVTYFSRFVDSTIKYLLTIFENRSYQIKSWSNLYLVYASLLQTCERFWNNGNRLFCVINWQDIFKIGLHKKWFHDEIHGGAPNHPSKYLNEKCAQHQQHQQESMRWKSSINIIIR